MTYFLAEVTTDAVPFSWVAGVCTALITALGIVFWRWQAQAESDREKVELATSAITNQTNTITSLVKAIEDRNRIVDELREAVSKLESQVALLTERVKELSAALGARS